MSITRRILLGLALVLAVVGTVWLLVSGYEHWAAGKVGQGDAAGYARCDSERKQERIELAAEASRQVAAARRDEQETAARAAEGERNARERAEADAKRQAAAARRAASAADGLSGDIAALDRAAAAAGIPDAASCPAQFAEQRDAATRARALFGACSTAYRVLAADAQSEGAAVRLQLATALSWIRATGAPGADE